jgi:hypothetical protein
MDLSVITKEQISFSFWEGYMLFDFYDISMNPNDRTTSVRDIFAFLKLNYFGKQIGNKAHHRNSTYLFAYGMYDIRKIEFEAFKQLSRQELLTSVLDFIINNYKEKKGENINEILRLKEIVTGAINKIDTSYSIILGYHEPLPQFEIQMRYDFYKSYILLTEGIRKYLHLEIAYD